MPWCYVVAARKSRACRPICCSSKRSGRLSPLPPAALERRLGRRAAAAGELFPELAKPGRSGSLPPEEARLRLFEAVGEVIDAAAAEQPVVLILDNLHWADAASLDLLCHLFCHRGLRRVLCVGASRAAEAEGNAALGWTLDRLNHDRLLTPLRLSPLSAEHIAALAADRLGGVIGGSLPDALHRHSEGNPSLPKSCCSAGTRAVGSHPATASGT